MSVRYTPGQDEEDVAFLKVQVQRLNAVLSRYQKKYLTLSTEDETETAFSSEAPHPPWLTNKQLLSPLLTEYDNTISELNQQISVYQSELSSLSSRVQEITEENTKLHSELRKSLESQLKSSSATVRGEGGGGSVVVEAVQQQMDVLSKERDSYIDMWRQTSKELEIVQKNDQEKTESLHKCKTELVATRQTAMLAQQTLEELQTTCQRLDEERGHCLKTVQVQEKELTSLQSDLSQTRTESKAASIKNADLKRSLDEITLQLKRRENERQMIDDHEQSLDDRIHHLQLHNTDIEAKLLVSQREAALLKGEKNDIEEALRTTQSKMSALEQREYEAVLHVKESMQISEDALMEKEQAVIREQQLNQEIGRLKKSLAIMLQEAGERTRNEVAVVREECNANIDKMAEEIQKIEQECGERQAQCERALRDKRAVEKELEKLSRYSPKESTQRGNILHELQSRVCAAERARDNAVMKLDTALTTIKSLEAKLSEEKQACDQMTQDHRNSQRRVQEEIQQFQQQKISLIGENKELQQKLRQSEHAREAVEMKLIKETSELNQRRNTAERELVCRLESSEEAHQRSIQELRELMASQYRVGARWREESKSLTQKFEQTVSNLKAELTKYKQHSEGLSVMLHQAKLEKNELAKQLKKMNSSNVALQQQVSETEAQAEAANGQLAALLSREKHLLQEKRELHRQLDKIKVKMNKIGGLDAPPSVPLGSSSRVGQVNISHSRPYITKHTPSHPHPYHTPTTLPQHTHLDSSQWNTALSELRHSIRQVRQDLGLKPDERQNGLSAQNDILSGHSVSYSRGHEDDSELSEHSLLSRGDLTPMQNSSHASLVQS